MKDLQIRGNRRLNPLIMQQPCNRLCKYLRYQCVGSARRSVQPWANITILAIKKMCVGRIFRIGAMKAGTAWPNGLTERLTQGRLAPRPSQGMLNNPLGTYAENGQIIGTSTNCNCIRYSLLVTVPRLPRSYRL